MSSHSDSSQDQIELELQFRFVPLSFSWVAIHPKPKGIIQFIGGALFGTFPTIFYHYFFKKLYEAGYTIIVFPFRFTFDHWSVSLELLREQYVLRYLIIQRVIELQYDPKIYLYDANYRWVGHSLGCKYILLLELLSGFEESNFTNFSWSEIWSQIKPSLPDSHENKVRIVSQQLEKLESKIKNIYHEWLKIKQAITFLVGQSIDLEGLFIRNEPSLLIAPDISDTNSAIPLTLIAKLIDKLGRGAKPTKEQTQLLIENSSLFSLMAIISFEKDLIAGNLENSTNESDVAWLVDNLKARLRGVEQLEFYHLEPHGRQINKYIVDLPGSIIVWLTGLTFVPLIPFSKPAKAFFNEVRKPIIRTFSQRAILEKTVIELLSSENCS